MSRLQSIVNGLKAINETVFQELCDRLLVLKNRNYSAFSRTGSQSGKQKSKKGTPDSFFLLPNGKYIYIESTTNVSDDEKLAKDIKACFDSKKTKIPIEIIEEIVLCFNFNIDQKQVEELNNLASSFKKDIKISYLSLDALSIELLMNHRDLVYEYLKLPLDTGQIVSIEKFIEEYNRAAKGIATPLDNKFLHRKNEIKDLKKAISDSDFTIITGAPGVGKTKLAIETITEFLRENETYNSYCISYKSCTLLEDLYQYFDKEKDYILFVDDANRIDAFNQITGFYKATRKGQLKILITVRNYAFQKIGYLCQEFNPKRIDINKLSDEQITDIIKADPFEILNPDYQNKIIIISDGNPRLAIMASLLAKARQNLYALSDVSDLFEKYFSTFVKDQEIFSNKLSIQCLGLIAFFYTIPYKNKEILTSILEDFGIGYQDFIDSIDKLDKLELVEVQFEHVKIPEQSLSNFFFYKSFIKENLLSFQMLLSRYFDNNADKFIDCIIPANNTFGPQNVMNKLKPELQKHWEFIKNDQDKAYKFLSIFWFYLQSETLEFVYCEIISIPLYVTTEYEVHYENNAFLYNLNRTIELLGEFFRSPYNLKDVIELAFEFTRRCPEHLPELIHKIKETLTFDRDDERTMFSRQAILFDILLQGLKSGDNLYSVAFYELAKTFLSHKYNHTKGGRNKSIYWYNYPIPNVKPIQGFRKKIWNALNDCFSKNPEKSLELLISYSTINPNVIKEIMEFDIPFILKIVDNHLSINSFYHCCYVQDQIRWCKKNSIINPFFPGLINKFTNSIYEMFLKMDWDRNWDRKEMYNCDNYCEYERLKEAEIRSSFIIRNQEDIGSFYNSFVFLKKAAKNDWNYNRTFDYIVDENCIKNFDTGIQILELVIQKNNEIKYVPEVVFHNKLNTLYIINKIWELLQSKSFSYKIQWELSYYKHIDESLINTIHLNNILKTISEINKPITIYFDGLEKFLRIYPTLFHSILSIITKKNAIEKVQIHIFRNLFSKHFDELGDDIELIKIAYLQQNLIINNFDYHGNGFLKILEKNSSFLIDFVSSLYKNKDNRLENNHRDLSFIWEIEGIEEQLIKVFDLVVKKQSYFGIFSHFCNVFFRNLNNKQGQLADSFLLGYIENNYNNSDKINVIIDIVKHTRKTLFEEVLLKYISFNQDPDAFSRIMWRGDGGGFSYFREDVIIADIEANDWRNILSIVKKNNIGIKLIPIKNYISQRIKSCLRRGDWERKTRFLENV
jgi:DNA polymerase III delta prime subunit